MATKVTALTRPVLRAINADVEKALATIAAKYGVACSAGRCVFNETSATLKVEIAVVSGGAKVGDSAARIKARSDWNRQAPMFGLKASMLDSVIERNGKTFKILGLMPRRRTAPIFAVDMKTGKEYVLPLSSVLSA